MISSLYFQFQEFDSWFTFWNGERVNVHIWCLKEYCYSFGSEDTWLDCEAWFQITISIHSHICHVTHSYYMVWSKSNYKKFSCCARRKIKRFFDKLRSVYIYVCLSTYQDFLIDNSTWVDSPWEKTTDFNHREIYSWDNRMFLHFRRNHFIYYLLNKRDFILLNFLFRSQYFYHYFLLVSSILRNKWNNEKVNFFL